MGRTACTEPQYLYKGALYIFFYLSVSDNWTGIHLFNIQMHICVV